ncbi:MAG: glycosyltransferase [Streptosporangiaceae bacterium]
MRLLVFPRDANPYQELLYGPMRGHGTEVVHVGGLTPSRTLNVLLLPFELAWGRIRGAGAVHLHWVWGFALPGRRISQAWFLVVLGTIRLLGLPLVWTAHNVLPHRPVFADDVAARRLLVRRCDLVILHTQATGAALAALGAPPGRAVVIPHGPFPVRPRPAPAGPQAEGPAPAESGGAGFGARTFVHVGRIEPYKGVEELLAAFAAVPGRARLVVAGACGDPGLAARLRAAAGERVELRLGHVPEAELGELLASADVVVLPFRAIATSGSALLVLSHGRPLLIPAHPTLADLPAFRYDGTVEGLATMLTDLAVVDPAALAAVAAAGRVHAHRTGWDEIAALTGEALASVAARRRRALWPALAGNALLRGSSLLLANTVGLAVLGFAFWSVAAHGHPPAAVGRLAALVAVVTMLAAVGGLGLSNTILRDLGGEGRPRMLVAAVVAAVSSAGALLAAAAFVVVVPLLPVGGELERGPGIVALVAALVVCTAVGGLLDAGLIALRATEALLAKNLVGGVLKLLALPAFASFGADGLVLAYAVGTVVACLLGAAALAPRLRPAPAAARTARGPRFSARSHLGVVLGILPSTVVPLQVLALHGAGPTAWFAMSFQIAAMLTFIPSAAGQVLFAEERRGAARHNVVLAVAWTYGLLVPAVVVAAVGAPWLLLLFGGSYAEEGAGCLRLLALAALLGAGNYLVDATLIAADRRGAYAVMNGANAVLVLACVAVLAPYGLTWAAAGWALAQGLSLLLGLAVVGRGTRRGQPALNTRT